MPVVIHGPADVIEQVTHAESEAETKLRKIHAEAGKALKIPSAWTQSDQVPLLRSALRRIEAASL